MTVTTISPASLRSSARRSKIDLIDVRTPVEYREVHVEFARNVPLDQLDPAALMQARNGCQDEPLYVICRSGSRGQQACEKFLNAGFTNVVNVEGGTMACVEAGLPVVRGKKAISLERQVRIAAGSLVLLGAAARLARASGVHRPVGFRRGRAGVRRDHRYLRDGHDPGPDAVEPGARNAAGHVLCRRRRSIMKLLIVGGVAGGASAAARARRLSEDAEIVLFERGPDVSFANCGLPYYVGGEIAERDKLLVTTPERLRTRFKLDVRTRSSVEAIDRSAKKVRVRDLASGREYEETYDKLILAPGAAPVAAADSRHRLARHLHAAEPARRGPDQGASGPGREAGRRGGGRVHRSGTGGELRPPWHRDHRGRVAGPGAAAVRQGDDHADRRELASKA